jgi:hypothetical protein
VRLARYLRLHGLSGRVRAAAAIDAEPVPEIYNGVMARQWAKLSRIGRYGLRPHEAHRALVRALGRHPQTRVKKLPALTNIRWPG